MDKYRIIFVLVCLVAACAGVQDIQSDQPVLEEEIRVLVTHPEVSTEAVDILRRNCTVIMLKNNPPMRSEILKKAKGVHGILWAGGGSLNGEVLDAAGPQLKTISDAADMEEEIRILVTHPEVSDEALDILRRNCKVTVLQNIPPVRSEILEKAKGVHGILWVGGGPLNGEVLDAAGPQLKAISIMQSGLDQVDIPELKRRRIPLGHTPKVLKKAVADLAVGLMLAAGRRFHEGRLHIENSTWDTGSLKFLLGQDLRGVRVGFFGFGNNGQEIAKRLKAFEIGSVIYHTRHKVNDSDAEHVTFDKLLEQSDILFIAAPLTAETRHKFDAHAFNKMKPTAVFVNVGRGEIVDQKALYEALKSNKIFAAGLDVMTPEPLPSDDPLLSLPNCVLVPHLGSSTERTRKEMALLSVHDVLQGIAGAPMIAPAYELEKERK